jgi:putative addiction module component (TIGR02574 family)
LAAYFAAMTLADFPELTKLSKRQRMKLAQELWVSGADDSLPAGAAHKKILDERWGEYQTGKIRRIPLPELERRLARRARPAG